MRASSVPPDMMEVVDFLEQSNFIEGEMTGLDEAVKAWKFICKKKQLTADNIVHTHKILMKNKDIPRQLKGAWRKPIGNLTGDVSVGGKTKPNWYAVPNLMQEWIQGVNTLLQDRSIKTDEQKRSTALTMHIRFEDIHPFIDGNGRVGRILMNWMLLKYKQPLLIIDEEDRFEYYTWFKGQEPKQEEWFKNGKN